MTAAETRFQNDQIRAKQSQMVLPAAQSALKPEHHDHKQGMGHIQQQPQQRMPMMPPGFKPMYDSPKPPAPSQPEPRQPSILDNLAREVHLEKLISSPEMERANTLVRLRQHLRGRKANPQETAAEVLGVLSNYLPKG